MGLEWREELHPRDEHGRFSSGGGGGDGGSRAERAAKATKAKERKALARLEAARSSESDLKLSSHDDPRDELELARVDEAVKPVLETAKRQSDVNHDQTIAYMRREGWTDEDIAKAEQAVNASKLTLNFPAEQRMPDGRTLFEHMADDVEGRYKGALETGWSTVSGHTDSIPIYWTRSGAGTYAEARDDWERRLFGENLRDLPPRQRPVYGAIDFMGDKYGASPFYGTSYFELKDSIKRRSTVTWSNSSDDAVEARHVCLASKPLGAVPEAMLNAKVRGGPRVLFEGFPYVEAQIWGGVEFARDIKAVHLDENSYYENSKVRETARKFGQRYHVPVYAGDRRVDE